MSELEWSDDNGHPLPDMVPGHTDVYWLRVTFPSDSPAAGNVPCMVDFADRCDSVDDIEKLAAVLAQAFADVRVHLVEKYERLRDQAASVN